MHVLAYSGVPMAASLIVWVLTALLTGEATFEQTPRPEVEASSPFSCTCNSSPTCCSRYGAW